MKSEKIIIIGNGNVDHGLTTLNTAILSFLNSKSTPEVKTINEIIEEEQSIKYHAPYKLDMNVVTTDSIYQPKDGKANRRERRANKRKQRLKYNQNERIR
jgi:hypothetical protein